MPKHRSRAEFEKMIFPHFAKAYNLARWLLRNPQDAEDAVQISYMKAFKAFDQLSGNELSSHQCTSWLLQIIRNTCLTILKKNANRAEIIHLDTVKDILEHQYHDETVTNIQNIPETEMLVQSTQQAVWKAIEQLPLDHREIIVLREFEDLSYRQIADITGVPVGTVMSRLSRARKQLCELLLPYLSEEEEQHNEL